MGWNPSIDLYLPARELRTALMATTEIADRSENDEVELTLPEGGFLVLPFACRDYENSAAADDEPIALSRAVLKQNEWFFLESILRFPLDDEVRSYVREVRKETGWDLVVRENGVDCAKVGMIDIRINSGNRGFRFWNWPLLKGSLVTKIPQFLGHRTLWSVEN